MIILLQRDTVQAALEFAKRNQLPGRIQDQMLSHVCLKFKTEGLKHQQVLNALPKAIRSSISHYLFFPVVQNLSLFQGVSYDLLFQLVRKFSTSSFQYFLFSFLFCECVQEWKHKNE